MRIGPFRLEVGPSTADRLLDEAARLGRAGHLVRVSLPSGVSFVGRPSVAGRTIVLRHATRDAVAHTVDVRRVAAITDVAVARPAPRTDMRAVVDMAERLDAT